MEIKKFDCTYRTGRENDSLTFEIIPDIERPIPETLFKLYGLNNFSIDALLNGYIYGSHPSQLNDYFDCNAQMLEFDESSIRFLLSHGAGHLDIDRLIVGEPNRAQKITRDTFNEIIYQKLGIISLTEDPYNLLMWSYYTNHKGFQVQFDLSKLSFKKHGPFPINYREELESVRISRDDTEVGVLMQTNLKHEGWKHENEWRVLGEKENMVSPTLSNMDNFGCEDRKFRYDSLSVIKSVQLGIRFFDKSEVKAINKYTLQISIKPDNFLKKNLLEFLARNEIVTGIPIAPELNKIAFWYGSFQQISDLEYVFMVFEDPQNLPLTLHVAIQKLLQQEERAMPAKEIADALNQNGWYEKKDGSLIEADQIHARKNKYPDLFETDESVSPMRISLKQ